MAVKLLNTAGRVVKNERGAFLWKVGNGYKMSRKAKILLGINPEESGKLGIGYDDEISSLVIKHDNTEGESNCSVNKMNIISKTSVVDVLKDYGNRFEISNTLADGFYIMNVVEEIIENNEEETTTNEELVVTEEDAFLS